MASTTPAGTLPKSNYHRSHTSTVPSSLADPEISDTHAVPVGQSDTFTHAEHVVPAPTYKGIDNLIIVCCHAIYHPDASSVNFPLHSPYEERNWHLAPFQKSNPETGKPGEHETFMAHVLAGVDALSHATSETKNDTLLVLSGGPTKTSLTPLSEAQSYYNAALAEELAHGNIGGGQAQKFFEKGRILLEKYATDSFQNLLFSILLFRRTVGIYPKHIRIITHAFKSRRFLDLHAPTIKWAPERIQVQGIDPVMSRVELEKTMEGEEEFGYRPWVEDPFGIGEVLRRKRLVRGWDDGVAMQLADGVEESVRRLLVGKVEGVLPWIEDAEEMPEGSTVSAT